MLLKKNQQQQEQVKGIYVSKEKRQEARNDIAKAHFSLGNPSTKFTAKSTTHDQFIQPQSQPMSSEQQQKMANSIRKSNFQIGQSNKLFTETSHATSFHRPQQVQTTALNQEVKNDLRKSHFHFGSDRINYETTNKKTFVNLKEVDPMAGGIDKKAQQERVQKMRTQHFNYGQDMPIYQSIAKKDFPEHNANEAQKNLIQSKENGKELRASHFRLGCDDQTFKMENSAHLNQGVSVNPKQLNAGPQGSSVALRKSNFQIGQSRAGLYETANGSQMAQCKTGGGTVGENQAQVQTMSNLKSDLRQSHFNLGHAAPNYASTSKSALVSHNLNNVSNKEQQELNNKLQRGHFVIGDEKKRALNNCQTTYKDSISNIANGASSQRQNIDLGLRRSHFNIGSQQKLSYVSEAKEKFQSSQNQENQASNPQANSEKTKHLRAHHFQLGETKNDGNAKNYFVTGSKADYNFKGDPSKLKGSIAQEVKDDLRASHFRVGFENSGPYQNNQSAQQKGRPMSAYNSTQIRPPVAQGGSLQRPASGYQQRNQNLGQSNKQSHVQLGSTSKAQGGEFKTSNQSCFKWIQPAIN